MKFTGLNKYSIAFASIFALAMIGCNSTNPQGNSGLPGTDVTPPPPVAPPSTTTMFEPKVQYNIVEPASEHELITASNYGYLIAKADTGFSPDRFEKLGLEVVSSFTVGGSTYYYLYKDSEVLEALKGAKKMKGVAYVEPDHLHYTTEQLVPNPINYNNPDPNVLTNQYGVRVTQTIDTWKKWGFGPHKPVVANIDTGVAYNNADLRNIVIHAYTWYGVDGTTLLPGQSILADPDPEDWMVTRPTELNGTDGGTGGGHGSHTCGTQAAEGNNGIAAAGMCWNVDLISYKGLSNSGSGGSWAVYGSLWHLTKWKKENEYPYTIPVNMSLGSLYANQFAIDMVELGLQNNIMVIASSGNGFSGISSFPGSYSGSLRVGGTDAVDRKYNASHYGPDLSVVAPGVSVVSTGRGNASATATMSGTSMSSPHVAGLVGYMLTWAPELKPDQIKTYIEQNADKIGGATGFTNVFGHGRINTLKTIEAVINDKNANRVPPSNYVLSSVKVKVGSRTGVSGPLAPQNGLRVYLYLCNADGTIQNYVASAFSGQSFVAMGEDDTKPEDGVAYFNMLKPGRYIAKAYRYVSEFDYATKEGTTSLISKGTNVFTVTHSQDLPPQEIVFQTVGAGMLMIQTYPTSDTYTNANPIFNWNRTPDPVIHFYDSATGDPIFFLDDIDYDVMAVKNITAGTYWIGIDSYKYNWFSGTRPIWDICGGPYALWVSRTGLSPNYPALFTWDKAPEADLGSKSQSLATAQEIELNKTYYGLLNSDQVADVFVPPVRPIDYYKIVIQ